MYVAFLVFDPLITRFRSLTQLHLQTVTVHEKCLSFDSVLKFRPIPKDGVNRQLDSSWQTTCDICRPGSKLKHRSKLKHFSCTVTVREIHSAVRSCQVVIFDCLWLFVPNYWQLPIENINWLIFLSTFGVCGIIIVAQDVLSECWEEPSSNSMQAAIVQGAEEYR